MSGMTLPWEAERGREGGPQVCRGSSLLRFRTQEGEWLHRGTVPRGVRPREEDVFCRCGCIPATACSWAQRSRLRDAWPHQIRAKCTVANTTSGLSGAFSFLAGGAWRSPTARWRGLAAPWLREGHLSEDRRTICRAAALAAPRCVEASVVHVGSSPVPSAFLGECS